MQHSGIQYDDATIGLFIQAYIDARDVGAAYDMFIKFKDKVKMSVMTYTMILNGLGKARRVDQATLVMKEMYIIIIIFRYNF